MRTIAVILLLIMSAAAQTQKIESTHPIYLEAGDQAKAPVLATGSTPFYIVAGAGTTVILTCDHYDYDKADVSGCHLAPGHSLDEVMTAVLQTMRANNKAQEEDRIRLNKRLQHIIDILNGKATR